MVDVLGGRRLLIRDGEAVDAEAALQNKVVALYFAAGRCASSRDFTPLLRDVYAALVTRARRPAPFEVVFVSADRSAQEMRDFVRRLHGAWLALPFHDPYRQRRRENEGTVRPYRRRGALVQPVKSWKMWAASTQAPRQAAPRSRICFLPRWVMTVPSCFTTTSLGRAVTPYLLFSSLQRRGATAQLSGGACLWPCVPESLLLSCHLPGLRSTGRGELPAQLTSS